MGHVRGRKSHCWGTSVRESCWDRSARFPLRSICAPRRARFRSSPEPGKTLDLRRCGTVCTAAVANRPQPQPQAGADHPWSTPEIGFGFRRGESFAGSSVQRVQVRGWFALRIWRRDFLIHCLACLTGRTLGFVVTIPPRGSIDSLVDHRHLLIRQITPLCPTPGKRSSHDAPPLRLAWPAGQIESGEFILAVGRWLAACFSCPHPGAAGPCQSGGGGRRSKGG